MPNVAIVTNMWGEVPQEVAEMRELQLRTEDIFFRGDMEKGAQMMRHDGSSLSAQKIIRHFVKMNPAVLQLQHEILVERKDVTQTDACAALDQGMHKLREKFRDDIQALKDEIEEALAEGGVNQQEELDKGIRGLENKLAEMDKARDELSNAFVAERAKVKPLIKELFRREQSRKGKGKASAQRPPPSTWKPNESQWNEIRSRLREQATEINTLKHQVQENKWETAGLAERLGDRPRIQHSASAGSINISGSELSGDQLLYLALFIVALMLSFMAFST